MIIEIKHKLIFLKIFFLVISFNGPASYSQSSAKLIPYLTGTKWGFCDSTKKILIPVKYDEVEIFENDLSKVKLNGDIGFVNRLGKEYWFKKDEQTLTRMQDGIMVVYNVKEKRSALMSLNFKLITPLKYIEIDEFYEGYAKMQTANDVGFVSKTGREIIPAQHRANVQTGVFSEGLATIWEEGEGSETHRGYIDTLGKLVIPAIYDNANEFSQGLAAVMANNKWGLINKNGKVIVPFKYDEISAFNEGVAKVKLKGKFGYIDTSGKLIIPAKYKEAHVFSEGWAPVNDGVNWIYINKKNEPLNNQVYDYHSYFFNGYVTGRYKEVYYLFDKKGKQINKVHYQFIGNYNNGLFAVEKDNKWGCIDSTGAERIRLIYDGIGIRKDCFMVTIGKKTGVVNMAGKVIVPIIYEYFNGFWDGPWSGIARVRKNGKYFYIDQKGTEYWEE